MVQIGLKIERSYKKRNTFSGNARSCDLVVKISTFNQFIEKEILHTFRLSSICLTKGRVKIYRVPGPGPSTGAKTFFRQIYPKTWPRYPVNFNRSLTDNSHPSPNICFTLSPMGGICPPLGFTKSSKFAIAAFIVI